MSILFVCIFPLQKLVSFIRNRHNYELYKYGPDEISRASEGLGTKECSLCAPHGEHRTLESSDDKGRSPKCRRAFPPKRAAFRLDRRKDFHLPGIVELAREALEKNPAVRLSKTFKGSTFAGVWEGVDVTVAAPRSWSKAEPMSKARQRPRVSRGHGGTFYPVPALCFVR